MLEIWLAKQKEVGRVRISNHIKGKKKKNQVRPVRSLDSLPPLECGKV